MPVSVTIKNALLSFGGICSAALMLTGCHSGARYDAASDVRAFLAAARANDDEALMSHVDRKAVRADLARQIKAQLTSLKEDQLDAGLDRLLQPDTFTVEINGGGSPKRLPSRGELASALRWQGPDRLCLPAGPGREPCAVTFSRQAQGWKLTGLRATAFLRNSSLEDWRVSRAAVSSRSAAAQT